MQQEWHRGEFSISTDQARLDLEAIHRYLNEDSYWAQGRPRAVLEKAVRNSLSFGVFHGASQIGFARLVTDYATFAYLADVFILPEFRGQGLSKWLMSVIGEHPELQGLRRWLLATLDAHGLYRKFGFVPIDRPELFMQKFVDRPDYSASPLSL
jgi:GNAT superfamily N-acetyltransferase